MSVIVGGTPLYHYCVNNGIRNDYILHLRKKEKAENLFIIEEKIYIFNREQGESFSDLRERIDKIAHNFCFYGEYPDMKACRTRKNFYLY